MLGRKKLNRTAVTGVRPATAAAAMKYYRKRHEPDGRTRRRQSGQGAEDKARKVPADDGWNGLTLMLSAINLALSVSGAAKRLEEVVWCKELLQGYSHHAVLSTDQNVIVCGMLCECVCHMCG